MRALLTVILIAGFSTACSADRTYDSGSCPAPSDWRKPGELRHHEQANFVRVAADGSVSVGVIVPSGEYPSESMTESEFLKALRDMKDAAPTPSYILQPKAKASCSQVKRLREAITELGNCPNHCGEGEGWTLFGDLPINRASRS